MCTIILKYSSGVVLSSGGIPHPFCVRCRSGEFEKKFVPFLRINGDIFQKGRDVLALPSRTRQKQISEAWSGVNRKG